MSQEKKDTIAKKVIESYDIANSHETMHLAQDLARFIKENNLFHNIQGKAYVNVEGWQYAGARLGILPVIEELANISGPLHGGASANGYDDEIKYQAKVKLVNLKTQQVTGSGFAICSNRESGKRNYQEFAIASMAQTRAIGKAYRNILAWIIRAAGYEPTPAEEMDYMVVKDDAAPTYRKPKAKTSSRAAKAAEDQEKQRKGNPSPTADRQEEDWAAGQEKMATVKQKTELLLLLNNKVVTNEEKNKMIENINKLDHERASKAIAKLKKVIEDRHSEEKQNVESHAA